MEASRSTFEHFASQGGSKTTGMSNKNFAKMCKDCKVVDGKKVTNADVDITFSKHKTKGKQEIQFDQFVKIMDELSSKKFGQGKQCDMLDLIKDKTPKAAGVTKTSKTGGVDKMTDTSQYTGSHKERFDKDGKGKGTDGRVDRVENKGYVGAYKGDGTYKGTD